MSRWHRTKTVQVDLYHRKTLWERIKAFLDNLTSVCALFLVLMFVLAAIG